MSALISVDTALSHIEEHAPKRAIETVPLENALGRELAAPVIAERTHPPAAMSAMDGYAVRLEDVRTGSTKLSVIGEAPAGRPFLGCVSKDEAVRIFTGSVIPEGADHVLIQENVERIGDTIVSEQAYESPLHIRPAGLDFADGDELIPASTILEAQHLSMAAASNHADLQVFRKLRVGIFANGDELKPPGSDLQPGEIINSNPFGLAGLIQKWGAEAVDLGIAGDSEAAIQATINSAERVDVFVPIGGASVGDHDHMRSAFMKSNFQPIFEKVAVRPGKPTWFSKSGEKLVLGLPGNPASALVCAHLFLAPLLGRSWSSNLIPGRLMEPIKANGPREHFMRARLKVGADAFVEIEPAPNQDSSLLRPFLTCNALLRRLPNAAALDAGEKVDVLSIGSLAPGSAQPTSLGV